MEIVLENNYLTRIETTDFAGVQRIVILNLKGNLISSIQPYAFIHMMRCKYLGLKANKLTSIEEDMFKGLCSLVKLSLSNNFIVDIDDNSFVDMGNCEELGLKNNFSKVHKERNVNRINQITKVGIII